MPIWIPVTKGAQAVGRSATSAGKKAGKLGAKGAKQVGKAGLKAGGQGAKGATKAGTRQVARGTAKGAQKGGQRVAPEIARKAGKAGARQAGKAGKAGAKGAVPAKTGGLSPDMARNLGRGARNAFGRGGSLSSSLRRLGGSGGGGGGGEGEGEGGGGGGGGGGGLADSAGGAEQALRRLLRRRLKGRRGPFKKTRRRASYLMTFVVMGVILMPFCGGLFGMDDVDGEVMAVMAMQQGGGACPQDLAAVAERTTIPEEAVTAYCLGATRYEMDWTILAGIGKKECDHGRSKATGCPDGTANKCGARGQMQFLGNVWRKGTDSVAIGDCPGPEQFTGDPKGPPIPEGREADGYATDGNGDGVASPWMWPDATSAAARYLVRNGVKEDPRKAIRAYNNSESYIEDVLSLAAQYRQAVAGMAGGAGPLLGGCPIQPQGSTEPIPAGNNTRALQTMANTLIACFGRNGHNVGCYDRRTQGNGAEGPYEHPRGRACDFMMSDGVAGGNDMERGTAMAEYAVKHAAELNILYVIWFNKVWSVSRDKGPIPWDQWRSYGCGTKCSVSSAHYNHVHVSVKLMPGDPALAECPSIVSCTE